jgi:hypothetical protein
MTQSTDTRPGPDEASDKTWDPEASKVHARAKAAIARRAANVMAHGMAPEIRDPLGEDEPDSEVPAADGDPYSQWDDLPHDGSDLESNQVQGGCAVTSDEDGPVDALNHADDRRGELVAEYMAEAMANDDTLVANVGVINADLMHIAAAFTKCLAAPLAEAHCPEAIGEVLPALNQYLKVVKQLDRLTNLTLRLKATERASAEIRQPLDRPATSQDLEP